MTTKPGRIPCINPRCRRTAAADKFEDGTTIVCHKCWKLLPKRITARYRQMARRDKRLSKVLARRRSLNQISPAAANRIGRRLDVLLNRNWMEIRNYFLAPEAPAGLETFLEELWPGNNDGMARTD